MTNVIVGMFSGVPNLVGALPQKFVKESLKNKEKSKYYTTLPISVGYQKKCITYHNKIVFVLLKK